MGIDDLVNKAKGLLRDNQEQIDGAIDKASEAIQDKTPDQIDGAVAGAAEKAKDIL